MFFAALIAVCLIVGINSEYDARAWCVVDAGAAASDLIDTGIYAWAASQRCQTQHLEDHEFVKCEMDLASAAEAINKMINVIFRALKTCGVGSAGACGMAAGRFTARLTGIASASGGVVEECKNPLQAKWHLPRRDSLRTIAKGMPSWPEGEKGLNGEGAMCMLDMKDSMNQFFEGIAAIEKSKISCPNPQDGRCVYDSVSIISAFAGLAKYLMGAVGHCYTSRPTVPLVQFPLACSEEVAGLAREVTGLVAEVDEMAVKCKQAERGFVPPKFSFQANKTEQEVFVIPQPSPTRLYNKAAHTKPSDPYFSKDWALPSSDMVLLILLPMATSASFLFGMRAARQHHRGQCREIEFSAQE